MPPEVEDYNYRSALAKLTVLGYFKHKCNGRSNHTYYGP
jgi:hypothetical protein